MRVALFTEAGLNTGYGHLYRCASVCQELSDKRVRYTLYVKTNCLPYELQQNKNVQVLDWVAGDIQSILKESDIIVVDSYKVSKKFYSDISAVKPLVIFDDNNRLEYPKGLVVNGGLYAEELSYIRGKDRVYLLGTRYTPLRRAYRDMHHNKVIQKDIRNVLITVNAHDADAFVQKLLRMVQKTYVGVNCYVVNSTQSSKNTFGEKDMLKLMKNCDLAISSSGQILHELIRVGLPTIAIGVAENQKNNILYASKKGLISFAGWLDDTDLLDRIEDCMKRMRGYSIRKRMHSKMVATLDGKGSCRIADAVVHYYESTGAHK